MPLAKYPDSVLTTPAQPVEQHEVDFVHELITETILYDCTWGTVLGLAAPQCLLSKRAFIASGMFFANPTIMYRSKETRLTSEGCYSLKQNKYDYKVRRHEEIDLHWFDLNWKEQVRTFKGKMAYVIQHEMDHLDGITLIERGKM